MRSTVRKLIPVAFSTKIAKVANTRRTREIERLVRTPVLASNGSEISLA
jgi:hypothetical protein